MSKASCEVETDLSYIRLHFASFHSLIVVFSDTQIEVNVFLPIHPPSVLQPVSSTQSSKLIGIPLDTGTPTYFN
jgi:hypothetical protein